VDYLNLFLLLSSDDKGIVYNLDSFFDFFEANYTNLTDKDYTMNNYNTFKIKLGERFYNFYYKFL
jgi:hypothetical protein